MSNVKKGKNPDRTNLHRETDPGTSSQGMKQIVRKLGTYQIGLDMQNENLQLLVKDIEKSRRRYTDLYELAPIGYFTLDANWVVNMVNQAGASMLGRSRNQLMQKKFTDFVYHEDINLFNQCTHDAFHQSCNQSCELRLKTKGGSVLYFHLESIPICDEAGNICEILMTATDISSLKKIEKAMRDSENLFRTIFETSPSAININRLQDGKYVKVNKNFTELSGFAENEVIGKTALDINIWVDLDQREQFFSQLHREGGVKNFIADFRRSDGAILNTLVSSEIISYSGEPHLLAVTHDVTELKKAEQAILKSHEQLKLKFEERNAELKETRIRYYTVVEALLTGVYMHTGPKIVYVNKEFSDIFGYGKNEMQHMKLYDLIHPDDREFFIELQENIPFFENSQTDFEIKGLHKSGDIIYLTGRSKLVDDQRGQQVVLGNIANISKRKLAEKERQKTEEELRVLSAKLMSAEERERKRIARDIHDSIGQALSAIKFSVENALSFIPAESFPMVAEALENIIPLTKESIEEVRRIIMDLRPSILDDLGLIATISWLCREFESIYTDILIEKEIQAEESDIPSSLKTVIYRILQEALNNAAKHSGTNSIYLQLKKDMNKLELLIEDQGQGFDLEKEQARVTNDKGMGLASMKERTQLSGGVYNIMTKPGEGTRIHLYWPLDTGSTTKGKSSPAV